MVSSHPHSPSKAPPLPPPWRANSRNYAEDGMSRSEYIPDLLARLQAEQNNTMQVPTRNTFGFGMQHVGHTPLGYNPPMPGMFGRAPPALGYNPPMPGVFGHAPQEYVSPYARPQQAPPAGSVQMPLSNGMHPSTFTRRSRGQYRAPYAPATSALDGMQQQPGEPQGQMEWPFSAAQQQPVALVPASPAMPSQAAPALNGVQHFGFQGQTLQQFPPVPPRENVRARASPAMPSGRQQPGIPQAQMAQQVPPALPRENVPARTSPAIPVANQQPGYPQVRMVQQLPPAHVAAPSSSAMPNGIQQPGYPQAHLASHSIRTSARRDCATLALHAAAFANSKHQQSGAPPYTTALSPSSGEPNAKRQRRDSASNTTPSLSPPNPSQESTESSGASSSTSVDLTATPPHDAEFRPNFLSDDMLPTFFERNSKLLSTPARTMADSILSDIRIGRRSDVPRIADEDEFLDFEGRQS